MFTRTLNISMTPLFQICKPDNKKTLTKGISSVVTSDTVRQKLLYALNQGFLLFLSFCIRVTSPCIYITTPQ